MLSVAFGLLDVFIRHPPTAIVFEALRLPPIGEFQTKQFDSRASVNNYTVKLSELAGRLTVHTTFRLLRR
jgi:hypothetical protein